MKSDFRISFERRLCVSFLLLLALQTTAERLPSPYTYNEIINGDNFLPWHRLEGCPFEDRDREMRCTRSSVEQYKCKDFSQLCFDKSMKINCNEYERSCTGPICTEKYFNCTTTITSISFLEEKAPSPGIPAKVYAECIPAVDALRDQCNSSFTCDTSFKYNPDTDELTSCTITCSQPTSMKCYNYTRTCDSEESEVVNTVTEQTIKIVNTENCSVMTIERRPDKEMVYSSKIIGYEDDGTRILEGSINIDTVLYWELNEDESWDNCTEFTQVEYEPVCNLFIRHIMEPLKDVVFDPRAHNLTEGIKTFLSRYDGGWEVLCAPKVNCFTQLIKFSRMCWSGLPLQRFLPGADYDSLESLLKNITRIFCMTTPPPPVKFEGDDAYLNKRNSCVAFFDVEHQITAPYYTNITKTCHEAEGTANSADMCTPECNKSLEGLSERFGCCLGSIMNQYDIAKDWYAHFNFPNNEIIRKLLTCGTTIGIKCEDIDPTSIVVTVVRNFIYIIGGIMTLVVVMMTVSFYWQLEHEPIKKAFYHF